MYESIGVVCVSVCEERYVSEVCILNVKVCVCE